MKILNEAMPETFDVLVIGCGAVGAAVARHVSLMVPRKTCIVLEKNEEPLGEASSGNTGHLATNF